MKSQFILILAGLFFCITSHARTQFFWDYSFGVDQFCMSSATAYMDAFPDEGPINKSLVQNWISHSGDWTNEALGWTPQLQQAWENTSSILLSEVVEIVGHPLERRELTISLFLCLNRNSMGAPLSINVPYYLPMPSAAYSQDPWWSRQLASENLSLPLPLSAFVEMTFHEVLHLYVMQLISTKESKLLECKYSAESHSVKAHLHVFALEKEVYKRLSEKYPNNKFFSAKVLEVSKSFFKVSGAKDYTRAWEIIDQVGAESFVDELRSQSTKSQLCPWCVDGHWHSIEWLLRLVNSNPSCT